MFSLFLIITVLISVALIVIVLLQASKGGGLAGTFGGSQVGSMFGTRRTSDFLSKTTWWLAGVLIVLAIIINLFFLPGASDRQSVIQQGKPPVPTQPTLPQTQQAPPTQ